MKTALRRQSILAWLEKNHTGYISDLSAALKVSAMTIRRDLQRMAAQGLVTPVRGGAVLNYGAAVLYSQHFRQTKLPEEKQRIAAYCASLVTEGSSVFIDCGSTAERIAEGLRDKKNITIMTNSLDAAQILSSAKNIKFIMVPGIFQSSIRGFMGQFTSDFMTRFHIDILFLGANGLDALHGLTSPDYTDAETKRSLIAQAKKLVVATDHTKLDKNYFVRIAALKEIDILVTDQAADPAVIEALKTELAEIVLV